MAMLFEWDDAKSEKNRSERGFGFDVAALIFDGPVVEWCDIREPWGEVRVVAIGAVETLVLTVIYTDGDSARRIISARIDRKKEAELWRWLEKP